MAMLWLMCLLMGLSSPHPADGQAALPGLSCVNDFVNNVTCTWSGPRVDRHVDCYVLGSKTILKWIDGTRQVQQMNRSCKLRPLGGDMRGCSFVFESRGFSCAEDMPGIQLDCNDVTVFKMSKYTPCEHIKMNPPGTPNVSTVADETVVSWSPGSPLSLHFDNIDFEVHIKHSNQAWQEDKFQPTQDQELRFTTQGWQAGLYQVRVRVQPLASDYNSHWSDWSPVTSWEVETRDDKIDNIDNIDKKHSVYVKAGPSIAGLLLFIILLFIIFRCKPRSKPVPDPSKYFHGLSSLPGKNLKKWLNPHSASGSYFIAHSSDSISPVVVVATPPPPYSSSCDSSITAAVLHTLSSGSTAPHSYIPSVSSSFSSSNHSSGFSNPSYQREPQSPDSGISIETNYVADEGMDKEREEEELEEELEEEEEEKGCNSSWEHGLSRVFLLASHSSSTVPPWNTASASHAQPHPPIAHPVNDDGDDYGDYDDYEDDYDRTPLPVGSAMGRSSSMPVEPSNSGYHTLKDLQASYSSKSI